MAADLKLAEWPLLIAGRNAAELWLAEWPWTQSWGRTTRCTSSSPAGRTMLARWKLLLAAKLISCTAFRFTRKRVGSDGY